MRHFTGRWQWVTDSFGSRWAAPTGAVSAVDLRTLAQMQQVGGQGELGLFASNETDLVGSTFLTDSDASAQDYLLDQLTDKADPLGVTGPKPLMPDKDKLRLDYVGKLREVALNVDSPHFDKIKSVWANDYATMSGKQGQRFLGSLVKKYGINPVPNVTPLDPKTTVSDDFNRVDGGLGASWATVTGTFAIVSNQYQQTNGSVNGFARYETDLSSTDHYSQVSFAALPASGQGGIGAEVRYSSSADTHYGGIAYKIVSGSSYKIIWKWVAGTRTDLVNTATTLPSAPFPVKLDVSGSTLTLYHNGSSVASTTDTSITTGTRAGIYGYQTGGTAPGDDFIASDGLSGNKPRILILQ